MLNTLALYLGFIPCADVKQNIEAKNAQQPTKFAYKNIDTTDFFSASILPITA